MFRSSVSRVLGAVMFAISVGALAASPVEATRGGHSVGHVFQATNDPTGNAIQVFDQVADGSLTVGALVPTGGLGSGDSLGSQGAVVRDDRHVLVVNAGDSTVSSLILRGGDLELRDVVPSGGVRPVSVTVHGDTVYVLNAGSDTISGLRLERDGDLRPISNSTLPLSATGAGGAQIQFSNDGDELIVTEKATAKIDVYRVGRNGRATGPDVFDSVGAVPFGFDIDRHDNVVVSEAAGGALSSYRLRRDGLDVVTPSLPDTQAAACWVEISRDGRFAFTTNAASGTISSYAIGRGGSLSLLAPVAATTGAGPTDLARSDDGAYLYARVRSGAVAAFAIGNDGSLIPLGEFAGAPSIGTSGLAAS